MKRQINFRFENAAIRATLDPSCKRAPIMRAFFCSFGSRLTLRSADFELIASLQLAAKSTRLLAVNKWLL